MGLFPTKLAASKAAGFQAIRLSHVGLDLQLEELDAHEQRIIGFVLHPTFGPAKKVTAVAITQMGSHGAPSPLSTAQRAALVLITNELKHLKSSQNAGATAATTPKRRDVWGKGIWEAIVTGVECGEAFAQEGLNPISDLECSASMTEFANTLIESEGDSEPQPEPEPTGPVIDPPVTEDTSTKSSSTSQDDPPPPAPDGSDNQSAPGTGGDGGGGAGGSSSDPKDDDKQGLKEK